MVVSEKLIKKVNSFVADEALILRGDEAVPRFLLKPTQDVIVLGVEFDFVLVKVVEEVVGAKDLGDLDQLVRVAVAVEKGLFPKNHGCKHGTKTPHVQAVVVLLEIDEELRTLEVTRRNTNVVFGTRMVKLGKTPVNQAQLVRHCQHNEKGAEKGARKGARGWG